MMKKKIICIFIIFAIACNILLPIVSVGAETTKEQTNKSKTTNEVETTQKKETTQKEETKQANSQKETVKQEEEKVEESKKEETPKETNKQTSNAILTSSEYLVSELYHFVARILPGTPVKNFKENLDGEVSKLHVYSKDGKEEITSGNVSTQMQVKQDNNPTTYDLSVIGDINGDGQANQIDLNLLIKHIIGLKGKELTGIYYRAGDLTGDSLVDQRDINVIIRYIVFGELDIPEIERPKTPTITVVSGEKVGENYVSGVTLKITSNEKDSVKTTYLVSGSETKEETEIPKDGVLTFTKKGMYQILAYTYSKDGVKSMPAKININIQNGGPNITFAPNGNTTWKTKQTTKVTIEDVGTGIKADSLKYAWVQGDKKLTAEEITTPFKSGQNITIEKGTGNDWHLWILAEDERGNQNIMVSESFYLDNTDPEAGTVTLTQNSPDGKEYKENTITSQNVYVKLVNGTDVGSGHKKTTYEVTGANTVPAGTTKDAVLTKEGTSKLVVTTEDNAGNVTTRTYTIKISKSALEASILTEKELTNAETISYTIVFNEKVVGFTKEDIQIENGTLKTFKQEDETTFTITVTTEENQNNTQVVTIKEGTCTNQIGNSNKKVTNSIIIDRVKPTASILSEEGSIAKNHTITITLSDIGAGLSENNIYQYYVSTKQDTLEGGAWTDFEPEKAFTIGEGLTGTYYIHVKTISDKAGNTLDAVSQGFVLDNIAPQVTFAENGNTEWKKGHGTIVTVEDKGGSIVDENSLKYMWSENTLPPAENSFTESFQNGQEIKKAEGSSANFYLWILAKDALGNTQITRSNEFALDNTAPIAGTLIMKLEDKDGAEYVNNTVTNDNVYIELVDGTDEYSGHKITSYEVTGANVIAAGTTEPTILTQEGNSTIIVTTEDNLGNTSSRTYTVKINKIVPICTITASVEGITNAGKILYTFTFSKDVIGFTREDINVVNGIKGTFTKISNSTYTLEVNTTQGQNDVQQVIVMENACEDDLGNKNHSTSMTVQIDRKAPEITITPNEGSAQKVNEVTITVNEQGSGLKADNQYEYYLSTSNTVAIGGEWKKYESGKSFEIGKDITGVRYIHVRAVQDNAGNTSSEKISGQFVFDNQGPMITFSLNGSTEWKKEHKTTVTVEDIGGSTVNESSIKYQWNQSTATPLESSFNTSLQNGAEVLKKDVSGNNWYLWILAKDELGNTSITRSNAFYLDNTPPQAATMIFKRGNAGGADYKPGVLVGDNIYIELINGTDAHSGHKSSSYEVTGANVVPAGRTTSSILTETGTSIITITTEDNVGNKATRQYEIIQDTTAPTVTFSPNGNATWAHGHQVKVTVEDTGGSTVDDISLRYAWLQRDYMPGAVEIEEFIEENLTNTFHNGETLSYDGVDGNYWFLWIAAEDKFGNLTLTRSEAFYFDNSGPVIGTMEAKKTFDNNVIIKIGEITDWGVGNVGVEFNYYCTGTNQGWSGWITATEMRYANVEELDSYTIKIKARDALGNESIEYTLELGKDDVETANNLVNEGGN